MSSNEEAMNFYMNNLKVEFQLGTFAGNGYKIAREIDNDTKVGKIAVNSYLFRKQNDREFVYLLNNDMPKHID